MRRFVRHPGEVLACFLDESQVSQNRLARSMGVPPRRINEILLGKRGISADTAIGLNEMFGMGEEFWMRLQNTWELELARRRREDHPRKPTSTLGLMSLDYVVLLGSGKYGDGFQEWLEQHAGSMKELQRGTRVYDPDRDDDIG